MNTKTTLRELADALKEANKEAKCQIRVVFFNGDAWMETRENRSCEWKRFTTLKEDIALRILGNLPGWQAWKRYYYGTVNDNQVPRVAHEMFAELPKRVRDAWAQEEVQK